MLSLFFLFGFGALIGNYYYGETNIRFLHTSKVWLMIYRISVLAMIVFGSVAKIQIVWDLADLFMGFMVIINLIAITLLSKVAFAALQRLYKPEKAGKDPIFIKKTLKDLKILNVGIVMKTSKRKVCNKKDIRTAIC